MEEFSEGNSVLYITVYSAHALGRQNLNVLITGIQNTRIGQNLHRIGRYYLYALVV